jgi:hypothetical protein
MNEFASRCVRKTLRCGRNFCSAEVGGYVPENETALAVACGNGQQRRGKIIAVNGM